MAAHRFRIASYLDPNPPNGKRVTRPSRWGNPYRIGHEAADAADAVALFRDHLKQHPELVELAWQARVSERDAPRGVIARWLRWLS